MTFLGVDGVAGAEGGGLGTPFLAAFARSFFDGSLAFDARRKTGIEGI